MSFFPGVLDELIEKFASLPGIGTKSAQRLEIHILGMPEDEAEDFANTILRAKSSIDCCRLCQNLTDRDVCAVCGDSRRDHSTVCVVADPKDVAAIERTREYGGVFHVLHGVISPMTRVGPDDIRIKELIDRVADGGVKEIIMATNPDTEGEATARYIARLIRPFDVRVTRLAYGIPVGGNLEFADDATLSRAIEGRTDI
jgi:recombination protein RecR